MKLQRYDFFFDYRKNKFIRPQKKVIIHTKNATNDRLPNPKKRHVLSPL